MVTGRHCQQMGTPPRSATEMKGTKEIERVINCGKGERWNKKNIGCQLERTVEVEP